MGERGLGGRGGEGGEGGEGGGGGGLFVYVFGGKYLFQSRFQLFFSFFT